MTAANARLETKSLMARVSGSENGEVPPPPRRKPEAPYRPPIRPKLSGDQLGVSKLRLRSTPCAFQAESGPSPAASPSGFVLGTKYTSIPTGISVGLSRKYS